MLAKHEIGVDGFDTDDDGKNVLFTVECRTDSTNGQECVECLKAAGLATPGQDFFVYWKNENPFFCSIEYHTGIRQFKLGFVFPDSFKPKDS